MELVTIEDLNNWPDVDVSCFYVEDCDSVRITDSRWPVVLEIDGLLTCLSIDEARRLLSSLEQAISQAVKREHELGW